MTIGPAPIIWIDWYSARLGTSGCLSVLTQHDVELQIAEFSVFEPEVKRRDLVERMAARIDLDPVRIHQSRLPAFGLHLRERRRNQPGRTADRHRRNALDRALHLDRRNILRTDLVDG